jgi:hypothetical protein
MLIPLFRGFFAMTTVSMFALYMKVSWTTAAASQFTLYMAMNNLGYFLGATLVTSLEGASFPSSLADYYFLGGLLPIISLVLLFTFSPESKQPELQVRPA